MTTQFDKILSGLVSNDSTLSAEAKRLHTCITYFAGVVVPGVKEPKDAKADKSSLAIMSLFDKDHEPHKKIAEVAVRYHQQTEMFIDADILQRVLQDRGVEPKEIASIMFLYDSVSRERVEPHAFKFWVDQLVDHTRTIMLAEAAARAARALEGQYLDPKTSIIYSGPEGFLDLIDQVRGVPGMQQQSLLSMPSGNIREELDELRAEVREAASGVRAPGTVYSGFNFVDDHTDGNRPGDVVLIGAFTAEGKTQFALNWAWHAGIMQSRNVLYITVETSRKTCRRRLLCRHSNMPGVGRMTGIPYNHIKRGRFSDPHEAALYQRVMEDMCTNPGYGVIDVTQANNGMTMRDVADKAKAFQDRYGKPLHLVVVDYLALMSTSRKRSDRREELVEILQEAKSFATSFDGGRGVVVVAPHQTKKEARDRVRPEEGKFYEVGDFADTTEAGKTIDVGIMLLRTPDMEPQHEIAAALVKNRDGDSPRKVVRLCERYATSFLGNLTE